MSSPESKSRDTNLDFESQVTNLESKSQVMIKLFSQLFSKYIKPWRTSMIKIELSDEEKLRYTSRAKTYSEEQKYADPDTGKMDCTGQLISERVDRMALNETRRSKERRQMIEKWPSGHSVCMETFYMLAFETLCELPDDLGYLPCEVACVSYSLYSGIIDVFHKFIEPGRLPVGYRYQCQRKSDYLQLQRRNEVEGCLRWLSDRAGVPNRLGKVYEMEVLLCELFVHGGAKPPSHSGCTNLLTTSTFDYEADTRCKYHEENEVTVDNCALGKAKKNCFCLSDALASIYNIELTSSHLPERQDVSTYLVIPPPVYGIQFSNAKPKPKPPQNPSTRGRGLEVDHRRREPAVGAHPTDRSDERLQKPVHKPVIQEEPVRRPTSLGVSGGMLAAKQVQPMKDREMGTKMAMLQPRAGAPSKFALPASAPPPSSLPLPGASWQGSAKVFSGPDDLSSDMTNRCQVAPPFSLGRGLGRSLGRGKPLS
ncbi:protein maelstrom homolog [Acanthaster planci]|uniref:Protein maelstrom homolog n=1 Tax=Acanthaster planci TaxID=133434 RepID=A0A8B7ZIT1_ACAPL|nr:protein maelstrom homolog [Acanthaster planci]